MTWSRKGSDRAWKLEEMEAGAIAFKLTIKFCWNDSLAILNLAPTNKAEAIASQAVIVTRAEKLAPQPGWGAIRNMFAAYINSNRRQYSANLNQ